jgi:hypothetical protein
MFFSKGDPCFHLKKKTPGSGSQPAAVEELHLPYGKIVSVLDQTIHPVPQQTPPQRNGGLRDRVVSHPSRYREKSRHVNSEPSPECIAFSVPRSAKLTA